MNEGKGVGGIAGVNHNPRVKEVCVQLTTTMDDIKVETQQVEQKPMLFGPAAPAVTEDDNHNVTNKKVISQEQTELQFNEKDIFFDDGQPVDKENTSDSDSVKDCESSEETAQPVEIQAQLTPEKQVWIQKDFRIQKDVRIQDASEPSSPIKATSPSQTSEEKPQTDEIQGQTSPEKDVQTQEASETKTQPKWTPGSRCRAVFCDDGMAYPAVVLWVKGDRCRIRYEKYDNEEELDVGCLLSPNELHGPRRTFTPQFGERPRSRYKADTHPGDGRSFLKKPVANPGTPPPVTTGQDYATNTAPPPLVPPPLSGMENGNDSDSAMATLSGMLQAWYMCGYRTGRYMVSVTCNCPPLPPPLLAMEHGKDIDAVAVATLSSTLQAWYMCGYRTGRYMTLLQRE